MSEISEEAKKELVNRMLQDPDAAWRLCTKVLVISEKGSELYNLAMQFLEFHTGAGAPSEIVRLDLNTDACPHPERNGRHEDYIDDDRNGNGERHYCRACGAVCKGCKVCKRIFEIA